MSPRTVVTILMSMAVGCAITASGFSVSSPIGAYVVAPGATAAFWICEGKVHEVSYVVLAIGLNCLLYAGVCFLVLWRVRSGFWSKEIPSTKPR